MVYGHEPAGEIIGAPIPKNEKKWALVAWREDWRASCDRFKCISHERARKERKNKPKFAHERAVGWVGRAMHARCTSKPLMGEDMHFMIH